MALLWILGLLLSGLIVAALGRLVIPGPNPMSIVMTTAVGIDGALLDGLVGADCLPCCHTPEWSPSWAATHPQNELFTSRVRSRLRCLPAQPRSSRERLPSRTSPTMATSGATRRTPRHQPTAGRRARDRHTRRACAWWRRWAGVCPLRKTSSATTTRSPGSSSAALHHGPPDSPPLSCPGHARRPHLSDIVNRAAPSTEPVPP
jgi:hypothetical protein